MFMSLATKLLRAVIIKTILEIIVVCGLVAFAAWRHFNPQLRGAIDVTEPQRIAGWALDGQYPEEKIEVQLFVDGHFVSVKKADERREDLQQAKVSTHPFHGFSFSLREMELTAGNHEVQVYAISADSEKFKVMRPLSSRPRIITIQ
jgi:phosphoglycerate-specific signal transduction histidine kinase